MTKKAARLYKNFRPEKHRLKLSIDPESLTFSGRVVIAGQKTGAPAKRLTLHQKDLRIKSAKIIHVAKDGRVEVSISRINTHKKFDELRLHSEQTLHSGQYEIEIEYEGKITDAMHGIYPAYFDKRRKKLIGTQLESHHAREVFPCIDEPEAKAIYELILETPPGTVISNTPIKKQKTISNKQLTIFEPTPRMSSYLLAFVWGELAYKEAKTRHGVNVRTYSTPDKKAMLDFALEVGVKVTDFFEDYFQTPYPLPKLDMIGLPDFSAGAMENWGLITFRESIFFADPKNTSIETKQMIALVVAHEIAHQWFGNLVTMRWWDDLWLNESFANLMEYVAVDALFPLWKIWEHFVSGEMSAALRRDSLPNVQSVRTKVRHPDELATLFDPAIVYAKGGTLLNMLRHRLGEAAFRKGLKIYFDKHKYAPAEADDLWQALSAASKTNVSGFMETWLNRPGFPLVEIDYAPGSFEFMASQKRLVVGGSKADDTVWQVPLAVGERADAYVLSKKSDRFNIDQKLEVRTLNQGARSYFIPRYVNTEHQASLRRSLQKSQLSTIDRLYLINGSSLMEKAGLVLNNDNLELVLANKTEIEEAVWGVMVSVLADAKRLVDGDPPAEADFRAFSGFLVTDLVKKLGWTAKPSDDAQTLRLRSLALSVAAAAEIPEILTEAKKRFAKFKMPSDLSPDIRDVVYFVAARFGSQKDFDKLLKLYKKLENADERNEIAAALTTTKAQTQIKQLLGLLKSDFVRHQDTAGWYIWLLRNFESRESTWQWLVKNWNWIEATFASDKSYDDYARYSAAIFSRPDEFAAYKKFFAPKLKILALERAIRLGIEEIEARVNWRTQNEAKTKAWLADWVKSKPVR